MKVSESEAREYAAAIGRAIADDGRASVWPWVKAYSYWPDVKHTLGDDAGLEAVRAAMVDRMDEREEY